jgi:PTH1 family peptidyl-tRNA hydrolase
MKKIRWPAFDSILGSRRPKGRRGLVVGLGNPGQQYEKTRHNVGFWCIDRLGEQHSIKINRRSRLALTGEGRIEDEDIVLAKPRTYVNESGQAVTSLMARYRASASDLLVVYDDMDLPAGKIRLRPNGGPGGHNGIKSIIGSLGTQGFARLRVGVGRPGPGDDQIEHVLGRASTEDQGLVDAAVETAVEVIACYLSEGVETAMNRYN